MLKQRISPTNLLLTFWLLLMCVSAQAAITVSVEANPDPVLPGETIYTAITVGNTGNSVSGTLTLQLRYPDHLPNLSRSQISDEGSCNGSTCRTNDLVTWNLGNIAPGASITVTLPAFVVSNTTDGTIITFDAKVFEDAGNESTASHSVVVQSASVLDIAVDENSNPVAPNQSLTYTITYANRSAVNTTNTQLKFPLPAGVSFVSASGGGSFNSGVVEWDLQTFPAKKGGRQTVTVDVNPGMVPGTLLKMDAATISGQANFIDHSASASAVTSVENSIPLTLAVELNPDPVQPSETIQGILTVANNSAVPLFGITLQLRYPDHLPNLSRSQISDEGSCNGSTCRTNDLVTWNLGNIAPGASITVTLPAFVVSNTTDGTIITFDAKVFEDAGNESTASHSVVVQSASVLDIAVDENSNPVAPNQSLTYTITYANRSAVNTTNTQLKFPLPAGVSFVSASGGGSLNSGVVEWDLQTFPAKKGGRQTVTVDVNPGMVPGTLLKMDAATISGQANFIDHSASASAVTSVENSIPLTLAVELNPDPVQPSETIQGILTVANNSAAPLFGITLQLRYPDHLPNLSRSQISDEGSCNGGTCRTNDLVTWNLGNIAPSASITVTLPALVNSNTINGTLISFNAIVKEDNSRRASASSTALVSEFDFVIPPSVSPPPVISPPVTPPSIRISDVDGNGQSDALTDGLLIIRFLFGLSGSALTEGAIGAGSSMNSTQIIAFLTTNSAAMDVDGNGSSDALTDGLLIIRYLFGIRGSALISGAIGPGATRSTIIDVENFLQDF